MIMETNKIVKMILKGLEGKNTHLPPSKALEGLTPKIARKTPINDDHSSWELLHHIVVWQEGIIEAINGKKVDWQAISKNNNWPTEEYVSDDVNFLNLVDKFTKGLLQAKELAKTVDLTKSMPAWGDAPVLQAFFVLLQHNSYHLGQIVVVRKQLGNWPS
jgi:uncharacterized damage-inducible protein DinB